ncbi:MAG: nucleotidyl transferase AbiEii/AbiGii toxin family protein [Deltaproteobacteria bacterium]|nr:nucleotidyl transferase AbiEii/AbiGii toxin family protein [Deltaproteobacteria bacterium]
MASRPPAAAVEAFHLVFLRVLETRLDRAGWVVKGGVNLRLWFGSPRCSEDLDLDALSGEPHQLREVIDKLVVASTFTTLLRAQGLTLARVTRPKQTETTQRWKLELQPAGGLTALHTKVEFSRRGARDDYVLEPALAAIVRLHGVPAPTAHHYTAPAAIRQKIGALAGRAEPQARDVFDLEHLLRTTGADPRPLPPPLLAVLPTALDRVVEMPFAAFKAQVVPFLATEDQEIHGTPDAWERTRELVVDRLLELQR